MLPCPVVPVLLSQSEVDHEQLITMAPDPHQEVVWLDVGMDYLCFVKHVQQTYERGPSAECLLYVSYFT